MEKKIEDYLHLYLGCECQFVGQRSPYTSHIKGPLIHTMVGISEKTTSMKSITGAIMDYPISEHKLLLRPLSDLTYEEKLECKWMANAYSFNEGLYRADQFVYLLSKGFDLFGLIESGLAIDKTKISHLEGEGE